MALGRIALAALAVLAYKNRDKLGTLLGGAGPTGSTDSGGQPGGLLDRLGASGGLGELLDRLRNAGNGDAVDSWVSSGPNQAVDAGQVEAAIDPDTLEALSRQTGMSREELLQRLSKDLPEVANEITPEGRLPDQVATAPTEPTLLYAIPDTGRR